MDFNLSVTLLSFYKIFTIQNVLLFLGVFVKIMYNRMDYTLKILLTLKIF